MSISPLQTLTFADDGGRSSVIFNARRDGDAWLFKVKEETTSTSITVGVDGSVDHTMAPPSRPSFKEIRIAAHLVSEDDEGNFTIRGRRPR